MQWKTTFFVWKKDKQPARSYPIFSGKVCYLKPPSDYISGWLNFTMIGSKNLGKQAFTMSAL